MPRQRARRAAQRDVSLARQQIDHLVADMKAHCKVRARELERAQPARQPVGGKGARRGDADDAFRLGMDRGEGLSHRVERARDLRRDPPPQIGEHDAAPAAGEQRGAQPLFEQLHLVAHRRLGHSQLLCGAREIAVPGSGFEHADGSERRKTAHHNIQAQLMVFSQ